MADEYIRTKEERPRDTVVVKEGHRSNTGLIILGILIVLFLLFWYFGNPFAGDNADTDVNVDVPTPNVNVETPNQ